MTCEIAIMNTRGIALAADSAATMGNGGKVYHSADKLFPLAGSAPVAVMTHGADALLGVPWEVVIASYSSQLGDRRFCTLAGYADDLITFIEESRAMFPEAVQTGRFLFHARRIWTKYYAEPWRALMVKPSRKRAPGRLRRIAMFIGLLEEDHSIWEKYPALRQPYNFFFDEDGDIAASGLEAEANDILAETEESLCELEREIFCTDDLPFGPTLPEELRQGLRTTLRYFLLRGAFGGGDDSGIVLAGMGTAEIFPSVLHYRVGTITNNRLKLMTVDENRITPEVTASILPFAQREMIDLIIEGMHPDLKRRLPELLESCLPPPRRKKPRPGDEWEDTSPGPTEWFCDLVESEMQEKHCDPIMAAVAALSKRDMAEMAEALVSFAGFRMKFLSNERETVGGPVDVAFLSKGDGFVWVKRKRLSC